MLIKFYKNKRCLAEVWNFKTIHAVCYMYMQKHNLNTYFKILSYGKVNINYYILNFFTLSSNNSYIILKQYTKIIFRLTFFLIS